MPLVHIRRFGAMVLAALLMCAAVHAQSDATPQQSQSNPPAAEQSNLETGTLEAPYEPITAGGRVRWFVVETVGPVSLAGGLVTAGFGTAINQPKEYGPHWGGFADRYGMRFTGISTGNAIEASLGAIWGEDPRYFRLSEGSFGARVCNIVKQTFEARRADGHFTPAYARFVAIPGNNFLSNTWRVHSEADDEHAVIRTVGGFGGRMAANGFSEFWPLVAQRVFHRRD